MASQRQVLSLLLSVVAAAAAAAPTAAAAPAACPPPSLDTVPDFKLKSYVATPWYAQLQVPLDFQRPDSFYCVRARYIPLDAGDIGKGIFVANYANKGRVNGNAVGVSGAAGNASFTLYAIPAPVPPGPTARSKLLVGPRQLVAGGLPPAAVARALNATANYRIVAAGKSKASPGGGDYDWVIVVGTGPSERAPATGLCGPSEKKDEGLWLLASRPQLPKEDVERALAKAKELGIDTIRMRPVAQAGCEYKGADPEWFVNGGSPPPLAAAPAGGGGGGPPAAAGAAATAPRGGSGGGGNGTRTCGFWGRLFRSNGC